MKLILITLFSSVTMPPTESTTPSPGIIAAIVISVLVAVVGTIASFLVCSSSAYKKWLSYSPPDCEQHNDFKLESQEQVKVEPLQTSALETPPQHIPKWLHPVATLTDCTSDGRSYYDKHNDFRLEIPEGAIPEGERVIIDIGVALYGPCQYLTGLRPVSPVFWVCVRDQTNFRFSKLVTVTIPHCLKLENAEDVESLGMTFLKGDHEIDRKRNYKLKQYNDSLHRENVSSTFEPGRKCGVLQTYHFCMLCIGCKDKIFYENAQFCLTSYIPNSLKYPGHTSFIFFITFLLNTCRETVRKHISDEKFPEIGKGENHREVLKKFQFVKQHSQCEDLRIVLPISLPRGWNLGEEFNTPVSYNII